MALASNYLTLDGATWTATPYHASLGFTGDFEYRCDFVNDDIDVVLNDHLIGRWANLAADRIWRCVTRTDGGLNYVVRTSEPANKQVDRSYGGADGVRIQVRVEVDMDDGAGNVKTTIYNREDPNLADLSDNTNWTLLGSKTIAHGGFTTLLSSTNTGLGFCGRPDDGSDAINGGRAYQAQVYDGIGGTLVANFHADLFNNGDGDTDTAVDSVGRTWTLNGTGTIVDPTAGGGSSGGSCVTLGLV